MMAANEFQLCHLILVLSKSKDVGLPGTSYLRYCFFHSKVRVGVANWHLDLPSDESPILH